MSDVLDAETILRALGAETREQLRSLSIAAETVSTQADALAAPMPDVGCAVYLAGQQSAGMGRRGRAWTSPPGANIYLSLARRFACEPAALAGLSLVSGIAIAEALNAQAGAADARADGDHPVITLKWPNDLIAGQRKLGGILINLHRVGDHATDAVIGVGINVRMPESAGAAIDQPWTDLSRAIGGELDRNHLVAAVLDRLLPALLQFERGGLRDFLPRWQRLDALAEKPVRLFDGPRVHDGICAGVTDAGALRIRQGEQEKVFHGGEVSLRPA